ncbi:hypothetical protein [Paenibacillus sp. Marseille-Q4541]|uniref:hypothetical protein n=1 Tax=Paenibacillus sp. Marseille-Q4541 TaxID=2831522 RepID=UPI001BABA8BD|nr:hypothetical protein [Paenibacillus sp. Marseille-Q4541]
MRTYPLLDESHPVVKKARDFIYTHARLLDRYRFEYATGQRSAEAILHSLAAYQNQDGGFGHGLEPDIRSPYSQPQGAEFALHLLDEVHLYPESILTGLGYFLQKHSNPETGGWPYSFRSVNEHPHAPWWTTEKDDIASLNPTGSIIGLLYKCKEWHPFLKESWFKKAEAFTWSSIEHSNLEGYHDVIQAIHFLEYQDDSERTNQLKNRVDHILEQPGTIELDPDATGYVHKVLDWAPRADSYAARFVPKEVIQQHLEHLLASQLEDGGWPISWPALSPAAEAEWRGHLTMERLKTLASYGMI